MLNLYIGAPQLLHLSIGIQQHLGKHLKVNNAQYAIWTKLQAKIKTEAYGKTDFNSPSALQDDKCQIWICPRFTVRCFAAPPGSPCTATKYGQPCHSGPYPQGKLNKSISFHG